MSSVKVYGRVAEFKGESARIEVLQFRSQKDVVSNINEIKDHFPPHGYVFAPSFCDHFDLPLNSLVEFYINPKLTGRGDICLMDIEKGCKRTGYPLIRINKTILVHEQSILQPVLKDMIQGEYAHFYIEHKGFAYGPFKNQNAEVVPRSGTSVNKFSFANRIYTVGGTDFILQEPTNIINVIDCMTQPQLVGFLKEQIRKLNLDVNIGELKRSLELQAFDNLDAARIRRIVYSLDKLEVGAQTLKDLAAHSDRFHILYKEALQNIKDELQAEYIVPLVEQKSVMAKEIHKLTIKIDQAKQEYIHYLEQIGAAKAEFEHISKDKIRLIEDIKIHTLVKTPTAEEKLLSTYDEQTYPQRDLSFENLAEFSRLLQTCFHTDELDISRLAQYIVYQLKDHSCFLTYKIEPILQMAKLSNNCKVLIQQVEPDWLKFERLYNNGLQKIWQSAHEQKSMLHFLILEDINISSIECYARPLLDLLCGIRENLPGQHTAWPENLWIFGIPVSPNLGDDFRMPLLKETFKDWGYIPTMEGVTINRKVSSDKSVLLSQIFGHQAIVPSFVKEYFS